MSQDVLALLKEALANGGAPLELAKATFQQATSPTSGLTAYDLEAGAKELYPVITLLRNEIPRVGGGVGLQSNWRAVTNVDTTNVNPGIAEGQRGGVTQIQTADFSAPYRTLGEETSVTEEAILAGATFDDVLARSTKTLLEMIMMREERVILGSNSANALGTTPTPTLTTATTGGAIAASTAVSVICVALTYDGWSVSSVANGVVGQYTRQNADGTSTVCNGGSAQQSAAASVTTGSGGANSVAAAVTPVRGAYAYAWYAGASGSERLATITSISKATITAVPTGTQLASALGVGDYSQNKLVHDGLLGFIGNAANNSYYNALSAGSGLTADGDGGIVEIDDALRYFWDNLRLSPTKMYVNSQEQVWLRKKIQESAGSGSNIRFMFQQNQGAVVGGGMPKGYLNPFSMSGGPAEIPIQLHPYMPPGTILFVTDKLPYAMSNITDVMRIKARRDYHSIHWPVTTRTRYFGVYTDQVLEHYFPPSMGIITNISPA